MKNDARTELTDARRLAAQGDYAAALEKHVWFHDNALASTPSLYGVRLSFALGYWIELGGKYPKALEKLKSIRDAKTSRLLAGENNRDLFHDVLAINRNLGESQATVELFKGIEIRSAQFASQISNLVDEVLVEAKEYQLAKKYLGDPMTRFAIAKSNFDEGLRHSTNPRRPDVSRKAFESIFTGDVMCLIIILQETGDQDLARKIQADALKSLDNATIRDAIPP